MKKNSNASNAKKSPNAIINPDQKKEIKDLKEKNASNDLAEINRMNLSKFAEKLGNLDLKEKKERDHLYIYPQELSPEDIKGEKGKKFRNSMRKKRDYYINNILLFAKKDRMDDLKLEMEKWDAFYLGNYRLNDYSLASISQSGDENKNASIILFLDLMKELKNIK